MVNQMVTLTGLTFIPIISARTFTVVNSGTDTLVNAGRPTDGWKNENNVETSSIDVVWL